MTKPNPALQPRADEMFSGAAAQTIGIPYNTLHTLMLKGSISARREGSRWFVKRADVEKFRAAREQQLTEELEKLKTEKDPLTAMKGAQGIPLQYLGQLDRRR